MDLTSYEKFEDINDKDVLMYTNKAAIYCYVRHDSGAILGGLQLNCGEIRRICKLVGAASQLRDDVEVYLVRKLLENQIL